MARRTLAEIKTDALLLANCHDIDDISYRLKTSKNEIQLYSLHPTYYSFPVHKSNGGIREVEAPHYELKTIQRQLNYYLQALYFEHQTPVSYGYIIGAKNKKNLKTIVSNAEQHLGNRYMINADFENFFHQIKLNDVVTVFSGSMLDFNQKSAFILAKLCTYNNRLPMGAPTSPVLSNLYAIPLDNELQQWAKNRGIVFTRFVDDLTFSSDTVQINPKHLDEIVEICNKYNLQLNGHKTKFSGPGDTKIVTGLVLNKTVDIQPEFYERIHKDLKRLKSIYEVSVLASQVENNPLLEKFKKEVLGEVNFIGMVEGYGSPIFKNYHSQYQKALEVEEELFSMRWTSFSYL